MSTTPCTNCTHAEAEHSRMAGCLVAITPSDYCTCTAYVAQEAPQEARRAAGLAEGRRRRDEGVAAAGTTAPGALVTAWKSKAAKALEDLIRDGSYFSADDLVDLAGMPPRPNMLGGVFIGARKAGLIAPVGYTQATRPEAHGRVQRTWKGA